MKDYNKIFKPDRILESDKELILGGIKCLYGFGEQFNAQNPKNG